MARQKANKDLAGSIVSPESVIEENNRARGLDLKRINGNKGPFKHKRKHRSTRTSTA